ncbi:hypothetical protein HN832_03060 [archaeon]|jgi:hypothetical protein|nr:hypothetical protein [archaeon]MBT4531678.1 hypothetical protein [archaeon]MBT7282370.1 hypothetical protein [archaeon]
MTETNGNHTYVVEGRGLTDDCHLFRMGFITREYQAISGSKARNKAIADGMNPIYRVTLKEPTQ